MISLHFTEIVGLTDAGLVFGWLPIQLAYDLSYTIVAIVLLYWVYTVAPDVPADLTEPSEDERAVVRGEQND